MSEDSKKLHLGCFDRVFPGWINTDITSHILLSRFPGAALLLFKVGLLSKLRYQQHRQGVFRAVHYLNVTKKFPYTDGIDCYVFGGHLPEHIYHRQALFCLSEIHRV